VSDTVSCMLVTRPHEERWPLVARSVACYARQTYPHRELVVVLDAAPEQERARFEARMSALGLPDLRIIRAPGTPTLGRLRNLAIEHARGELLCVWDDDDLHHPRRIEVQTAALRDSGAAATFLTDVLHLVSETREVYWTTYKHTVQRCLPGTGLFHRSVAARYPEVGPESARTEDTAFCRQLFAEARVHLVDSTPNLYVYVHHGSNTSGDAHHRMLVSELALSRGLVGRRSEVVRDALDHAELDTDELRVMGSNGEAFAWRRSGTEHV
jgi:glycosyltransferase involved in cell wall biosynthesis